MHVRTSSDKERGTEKTRNDKRVEGRKGQVFCEIAKTDVGALLDRETRSGGCSTFLRHRCRSRRHPWFSLPRGTAVFHRSLRIFSHLAASTCLPRRLPRPVWLSRLRSRFLSFILRCPSLPSLPFSPVSPTSYTLQSLPWLPVLVNRSSLFLSLSFFFYPFPPPFCCRIALLSNGGRHKCPNIFPLSLSLPLHPLCSFTVTLGTSSRFYFHSWR